MNKHSYQARELQRVDWAHLGEAVRGQRLIFGVDVAKTNFYGVLMNGPRDALVTVRWQHPDETMVLGELLSALPAAHIEVALEPSGTYGDSLCSVLRAVGCAIYLVSPKRVHDAAEVYDGVPSLHDAKAAYLIGRLHAEGVSKPWATRPPSTVASNRHWSPSWISIRASTGATSLAWRRCSAVIGRNSAALPSSTAPACCS